MTSTRGVRTVRCTRTMGRTVGRTLLALSALRALSARVVLGGLTCVASGAGCGDAEIVRAPDVPSVGERSTTSTTSPRTGACGEGFSEVTGGACLLVATAASLSVGGAGKPRLVVFLHGLIPEGHMEREIETETKLGALAAGEGWSMLALRGEKGLCNWNEETTSATCWPSKLTQVDDATRVIAKWKPVIESAAHQIGTTEPPYVVGFSNGGFFAAMIAQRALMRVSGVGVIQGGNVGEDPLPSTVSIPLYVGAAAGDTWQTPACKRLAALATDAGWPSKLDIREGGHELRREDFGKALAFFVADRTR